MLFTNQSVAITAKEEEVNSKLSSSYQATDPREEVEFEAEIRTQLHKQNVQQSRDQSQHGFCWILPGSNQRDDFGPVDRFNGASHSGNHHLC